MSAGRRKGRAGAPEVERRDGETVDQPAWCHVGRAERRGVPAPWRTSPKAYSPCLRGYCATSASCARASIKARTGRSTLSRRPAATSAACGEDACAPTARACARKLPSDRGRSLTTLRFLVRAPSTIVWTSLERLALATREWAETYVRPLLVRPLTVLQLPEIFRAGVFLSWLAEVGGEVCVVEIQFTTSVDGGHIFYAGTEGLELYSISVGSLDHCRVQLRHPSSGITALVLHDLSRLDFEQILAQVPNLEYLMHFDNGPNRNFISRAPTRAKAQVPGPLRDAPWY